MHHGEKSTNHATRRSRCHKARQTQARRRNRWQPAAGQAHQFTAHVSGTSASAPQQSEQLTHKMMTKGVPNSQHSRWTPLESPAHRRVTGTSWAGCPHGHLPSPVHQDPRPGAERVCRLHRAWGGVGHRAPLLSKIWGLCWYATAVSVPVCTALRRRTPRMRCLGQSVCHWGQALKDEGKLFCGQFSLRMWFCSVLFSKRIEAD